MKNNQKLITSGDVFDVLDSPFKTERERIKYISSHYKKMSVAKAFALYYNLELSDEIKSNKSINQINSIEIGKVYTGTVKVFNKNIMTFDMPGIKEEIVCKESFATCMDSITNSF